MNTILTISTHGTVSCLYTELIDLSSLGKLEIQRASHIEFNNFTQQWEVKNLHNRVLFFAHSRQTCLDWEHDNL